MSASAVVLLHVLNLPVLTFYVASRMLSVQLIMAFNLDHHNAPAVSITVSQAAVSTVSYFFHLLWDMIAACDIFLICAGAVAGMSGKRGSRWTVRLGYLGRCSILEVNGTKQSASEETKKIGPHFCSIMGHLWIEIFVVFCPLPILAVLKSERIFIPPNSYGSAAPWPNTV